MREFDFTQPDFPILRQGDRLSSTTLQGFRDFIHRFHSLYRRELPWRNTSDPYEIMVSEFMLQQTQVDRVLQKYVPFISIFPDVHTLDSAGLKRVLSLWQGLGYNRRCIAMKKSAGIIVARYGGRLPRSIDELMALPGIGRATASAIVCFSRNLPVPFIETNIRNVFIHLFFQNREGVHDRDILPFIDQSMDRDNPREWYYALMDYGSMLKKAVGNLNARSRHYSRQPPFDGSDRQLRGRLLRLVLARPGLGADEICDLLKEEPERIGTILKNLEKEGFFIHEENGYRIAE
jgi:A/G-specific adenine glycosylase